MVKEKDSSVKRGGFLQTIFGRSLGRTLFFSYLFLTLIPFSIVGWFGFQSARESIQQNKFDQLTAVSQLKKDYIITYFNEAMKNVRLEAELSKNREFLGKLRDTFRDSKLTLDAYVKDLRWNLLNDAFGPDLRRSLLRYNFLDIYLIDPDGNILFSVQKRDDLGTNLLKGRYANTKFANAVQLALEKNDPVYSDLQFYEAANNETAGFLAQSMVNDKNQMLGVLAVQVSTQPINAILQDTTGLGETGETYLVGTDLLMRSKSRFSEDNSVLKITIDTEASRQWLQKTQAAATEDLVSYSSYRGKKVLGVYQNFEIAGIPMALVAEIDQAEAFYPVKLLGNLVGILFTATGITVILIAFYMTVRIVAPLRSLSRWARRIAQGELIIKEMKTPKNEIGELTKSFQEVVKSFQEVTYVCQAVSVGDYSQSVDLRSDHDVLANSINQMANTLRAVVKQANTIAEGDYSLEILPKSAKDQIAIALTNMTHRLKTISAENERQQWFKTGQAELSNLLRGEQNLEQLGEHVISFLCRYLKADIGSVYFRERTNQLRLVATYAFTIDQAAQKEFRFGEGLIGQVAEQQEKLIVENIPSDFPLVKSSIIHSPPKQLIIIPLIYEKNTMGVIEIGKLVPFVPDEFNFIELMAESIAIAFASNQARLVLADMLDQSQQQADVLERQQRALKQANEDLEQKTKELVTANQYKSDFLARMSHELRTPLNSILILSKTFIENRQNNLLDKQIDHAKVIYSSGSDLLMLINDILDLAKVEAGRMEILIDKISPQALCDYLSSSFMPIAEDRNLRFLTRLAPDVPSIIYTDRQRLEQILRNLISNAFKFTQKGSIEITIQLSDKKLPSLLDERATGRVISFQVKDTGCGIPKEKQDIIFEAFRQADSSISRKYGGTGLGLNISKELANALGGYLEITQSEEGKGSLFSLYLPEKLLPMKVNSLLETKNLTEEGKTKETETASTAKKSEKEAGEKFRIASCGVDDQSLQFLHDNPQVMLEKFASFAECQEYVANHPVKALLLTTDVCQNENSDFLKEMKVREMDVIVIGKMTKQMKKAYSTLIDLHVENDLQFSKALQKMLDNYLGAESTKDQQEKADEKISNILQHTKFVDKEVLIVDDDMRNIYALNSLLEDHGIKVAIATSGKESLDLLNNHPDINLVFMDIMMPEMSGIEVIKQIRSDANFGSLPIVALTARATKDDEEECLAIGANEYIAKPIDPDKLQKVLKKWLN